MKNNIIVVFSSHLPKIDTDNFIQHINDTIGIDHEVYCYPNFNQYSLSEIYNKAMEEHANDNSIMVFVHHDVIFRTQNWGKKLLKIFNNTKYSIIGLAGSITMYDHGCWWLTEDMKNMSKNNMIGRVWHTNGLREWCSDYNSKYYLKEVCVIDGLFIAVDINKIVNKFDENIKGFHYYEIDFAINNYLDGCDIAVTNSINVLHKSIGVTNKSWEENRKQFIEKYKEYLPIYLK